MDQTRVNFPTGPQQPQQKPASTPAIKLSDIKQAIRRMSPQSAFLLNALLGVALLIFFLVVPQWPGTAGSKSFEFDGASGCYPILPILFIFSVCASLGVAFMRQRVSAPLTLTSAIIYLLSVFCIASPLSFWFLVTAGIAAAWVWVAYTLKDNRVSL